MFHRVNNVKAIDNFILEIVFQDDTRKYYDVAPLFLKWPIFNDLKNIKGLFKNVQVDIGGYGIFWNEKIDLSCNELWENGRYHL